VNKALTTLAGLASGAQVLGQPCTPQHITPPEPWWRASFGYAAATNARHLVIGDHSDASLCPVQQNCVNGAVHTYRFDSSLGQWRLRQTLFPSDIAPYYTFGGAVALHSERLVIGSPRSDLAAPDTGAAYVFDFDGERWVETGQIAPVEPYPLSGFGIAVAIRGSTALVGEPSRDWAWVYQETPSGWEVRKKLTPPDDPPINSEFGNAVAITDDWVFVAAHFDKSLGTHSGGVYVYRREAGGGLCFTQKLLAPDPEGVPEFGRAVAVDGNWLVVGAPRSTRTTGQGVAHIFELAGGRWEWRQEITHDEPVGIDGFGQTVALHGDTLVAGAPRRPSGPTYGAVYVFKRGATGEWRQTAQLDPAAETAPFGKSIATDGRWAVVGSPDETVGEVVATGAAYIFDLACLLCRADLDGDGELTFFDFLAFQNLFAAGDLRADFDGDGALTFFDFLAFQNEFAAGCA